VIPVVIPPLRERNSDVISLAEHFIKKYSQVNEKKEQLLSDEAKASLKSYSWPGNVRELENIMERAVLICNEATITPQYLFLEKVTNGSPKERVSTTDKLEFKQEESKGGDNNETLYDMEKSKIFDTLNKVDWNKTKASKILGISVRTMRNKLHEYGISDGQEEDK
jgi:DNA-binding NtrC family response regulator